MKVYMTYILLLFMLFFGCATPPQQTSQPEVVTEQILPIQATIDYEVGEIINFGDYEWIVLEVLDNKALIITTETLAARPYHSRYTEGMTWENCSLREYLNGAFLESFNDSDRDRIALVELENPDNPQYGTAGGNTINCRVFTLSIEEAQKYFSSSQDRLARDTNGVASWYWLRSPGDKTTFASAVRSDGSFDLEGRDVNNSYGAVRPALWLNP